MSGEKSGPPRTSAPTEKTPVRYMHWFCQDCQRKLGGLGYLMSPVGRAEAWHNCGLCGKLALIIPTDLYKPKPKYQKRTGAGERERASRRDA